MKPRALLLLWSLALAAVASPIGEFADRAGAAPAQSGAPAGDAIILVGASGQDSVGSLLSLPLMPSPRFRTAGPRWGKGKLRPCCTTGRMPNKNRS
jgi:hypothetical protein